MSLSNQSYIATRRINRLDKPYVKGDIIEPSAFPDEAMIENYLRHGRIEPVPATEPEKKSKAKGHEKAEGKGHEEGHSNGKGHEKHHVDEHGGDDGDGESESEEVLQDHVDHDGDDHGTDGEAEADS